MGWLPKRRRNGPGPGALVAMAVLAFLLVRGDGCASSVPGGSPEPAPAPGARIAASVVRAVDGDTIVVSLSGKDEDVRMIGVDTPETVDPDKPVQCGGPEASAFTHGLLSPGTAIELEIGAEARDKYGRLLAYIFRGGHLF